MKFGVNILNFGPRANPETMLAWATFAEEKGFHLAMISDHVAVTPDVQGQFPVPFYDPFVTLGWIAGQTSHIQLGTTVVILPYRHPLQAARMATNLDQLSQGRFIFGVGIGWARDEFAALNVPHHQRGQMSDEYLEVIQAYFAQEIVSYDGNHVAFKAVYTAPHAAQKPHLPLWIGGSTPPAIRRAARFGDAWHPYRNRVDWLRDVGMPQLRQQATAFDRPVPDLCPRITVQLTESPWDEQRRVAGQGSMAQIREDLIGLQALGATHVLLDTFVGFPDERLHHPERDWEMLAEIADQILDLKAESVR